MTKLHQISKRKLMYASIISIIFVLSMVINVGLFTTQNSSNTSITSNPNVAATIDTPWTGMGNNQTVRSYIENDSTSVGNTNSFNVTVPTSPSQIYSGNMNFTFNQDYTTNYTFEDSSPLLYPSLTSVDSRNNTHFSHSQDNNTCTDHYSLPVGTVISGSFNSLIDTSTSSALSMSSESISPTSNVINFTYMANFSSTPGYDRSKTMGMRYYILRNTNISVSMNLYAFNYYTNNWDLLKNYPVWNSTTYNEIITVPNTNLAYFDPTTNMTQVRFELYQSSPFSFNIYNFRAMALNDYDAKITDTNMVGLEFDLRGNATVYGFNAYIRTLTNDAQNYNLTISLYRANQTATPANVTSPYITVMKPGTELISSYSITGYSKDEYAYIPFYSNGTGISLNISNYFVVLSSNSSTAPYSILGLPYSGALGASDPSGKIDHLFLVSSNTGNTWTKKYLTGNSYQYDAAPFAIKLTRGWIPSDVNMTIDNQTITTRSISTGIFANTSPYQWGLGTWNHIYQNEVRNVDNNITVALDWNKTITSTLNFNVTYNITVFSIEEATCAFNITLGQNPLWYLNYTLDRNLYTSNWIFKYFSFIVSPDWHPNSILDPNGINFISNLTISSDYSALTVSYSKTVKYSGDGLYQLNCTSNNYIENMTSYLHYNNYRWETRGFMLNDNISTAVKLLNFTDTTSQIDNGMAECYLYDPAGEPILNANLTDYSPEANETYNPGSGNQLLTIYNFDGTNIFNTTSATPKGEYSLVFKWTDGNEIGYDKLPIYVGNYQANINDIYVDNSSRTNVLLGLINNDYTNLMQYNSTIFAINQTTGSTSSTIPYVNDTLGKEYSDYMINITSFTMNESVINIGETINLTVTVNSYNDFWTNYVKLGVQFVQSCDENWIVMQQNSTELALNKTGSPNNERVFQFTFQVPTDFKGVNAPIRLNPLKVKITPWINGLNMSAFDVNNLFPLVNQTKQQFEGNVLGYTTVGDHSGKSLIIQNNRTYSNLPGDTTYLVQVYDKNFVSTQIDSMYSFSSEYLSEITNLTSSNTIVWGNTYKLNGYLQDEFGNPIADSNVDIQYLLNNTWYNYNQLNGTNSLKTNDNGYFTGVFNSTVVPKSSNITVKASWIGDSTHYSTNTNATLQMNTYNNQVEITMLNSSMYPHLTKGSGFEFTYKVTNIGNSTLNNLQFSLGFPNTQITIEDLNASMIKILTPGNSMTVGFYVEIPSIYSGNSSNVTLYVNGTSVQSSEFFNSSKTYNLPLYDQNLFTNWREALIVALVIGIIVLFIGTVVYIINTRKKLQEVPEVPSRTVKRGRYVKVSELQKVKPEEKVEEKKEQKQADLDELLKEEGLDKKKSE